MSKKDDLLKIASVALSVGSLYVNESLTAAPQKGASSAECFGINTEKGVNGCAVSLNQIELANRAYANKFATSKPIDCAGHSDCSAKNGFLAWVSKASIETCLEEGGFIFEKSLDGKLTVKDKNGMQKN